MKRMDGASGTPGSGKRSLPFRFANDLWRPDTVTDLKDRLNSQTTPPEQSAALLIGSGGLPYLLGMLREAPRIFDVDYNDQVLAMTAWRTAHLRNHRNWTGYHQSIARELSASTALQRASYTNERRVARDSGLQGDYAQTRARSEEADFTFMRADIRVIASHIGTIANREDRLFTLVNFTNVGTYLGASLLQALPALGRIVDRLPIAPDAVIIDSLPNLVPKLYTLEEYRSFTAGPPPPLL